MARRLLPLVLILMALPLFGQINDRSIHITLDPMDPRNREIGTQMCRTLVTRLSAMGWQVTCTEFPALPGDTEGEAGVVTPFDVRVTLPDTEQIAIDVTATFIPTGERILVLSLTGPRRLGIQRKAETIADELLVSIDRQVAQIGGRDALRTLLAQQITEPAEIASATEETTTEETTEIASATEETTTEEPGSGQEQESTSSTVEEAAIPEPTEEQQESQEQRALREANARRIVELERDLAVLKRRRSTIIRRSRIAWIAGSVFLGSAGGAWVLAENNYQKYDDATVTEDAISYRDRTVLFRNLAVGVGIAGTSAVAGGLSYRYFAGKKSGLDQQIREIREELRQLQAQTAPTP